MDSVFHTNSVLHFCACFINQRLNAEPMQTEVHKRWTDTNGARNLRSVCEFGWDSEISYQYFKNENESNVCNKCLCTILTGPTPIMNNSFSARLCIHRHRPAQTRRYTVHSSYAIYLLLLNPYPIHFIWFSDRKQRHWTLNLRQSKYTDWA